jgi:exodeoxyribonuclease VII large subunit
MSDRLPFNPAAMAHQRKAPTAPVEAPLTVSQLAGRIQAALAGGLPAKVRVIGEVSGFRERTHWYFDLKDAGAVVNCAMFATNARRMKFQPQNGQEVVVTGRVEFYDKQGKVSLLCEKLEPVGAGALELAFRALCEEIRALGWFAPERKRPIPGCPSRVAVVTSRSGAALQDVLDTMRKRCPSTRVSLVDVRVQGDGAAEEVAAAVRWLGTLDGPQRPQVILVTRGGGSMEDLWAFNERVVAEAIVQSPIPVVAAIGHETDTTIAELVADLRCATPTQAAMRLTPDSGALMEQLDALASRMRVGMNRVARERRHLEVVARQLRSVAVSRLRNSASRLERVGGKLEQFRPAAMQARRASALHSAEVRLHAAVRARLTEVDVGSMGVRLERAWEVAADSAGARLEALARQLTSVGPQSVLQRGFSYTKKEDGGLVRSVADVALGARLVTRLADGEVRSRVEGESGVRAVPTAEQVAQRPRRKRRDDGAGTPGLFGDGASS